MPDLFSPNSNTSKPRPDEDLSFADTPHLCDASEHILSSGCFQS